MAITHAAPGEAVGVRPFGELLANQVSHTLVKTDDFEIIRLVLAPNKKIDTHSVPGPLIVQCLEGRVIFTTMNRDLELLPGHLIHLRPNEPHSVEATEASSLLLTVLLPTN